MKKTILGKIFVVFAVLVIFVLFAANITGKLFEKQIANFENSNKTSDSEENLIDWQSLYPYDKQVEEVSIESAKISKVEKILNKYTSTLQKLNLLGSNFIKHSLYYGKISNFGTKISGLISDSAYGGSTVELKCGGYITLDTAKISEEAANKKIATYKSLDNYLDDKGIAFEYFYAPVKECKEDDELPSGSTSYANDNIDTYIKYLEKYGISYVDFREEIHKNGLNHYEMFYLTDHHWKIEYGKWATNIVVDKLNSKYNLELLNVDTLGKFENKTYKDSLFGSFGNTLTHANADSEDMEILIPTFETNFRYEVPEIGIDKEGSFAELFIDYDVINEETQNGGGYSYEAMMYGNRAYEKITNLNNPNGKKILMIKDSFGLAVAPYLALSCSELVMIDIRSGNGNFDGSIVNLIDSFNPDIVIALQSSPTQIIINR